MYGWCGKLLRVNLSEGSLSIEELDPKLAFDYIGGRGLGSKYLADEVEPKVEPLSPDNKLILATGPTTGAGVAQGARYMAVTKAPLTGTIGSSNSGGFWGPELKFAGYDLIIFEGKAKEPVYLWINDDNIEIRSATHLWGKNTPETQEQIRNETNPKAKVACIGPAGEKLVKFACIINDEGRAAGRSGVGAVMGTKNLKAVAVRGSKKLPVADEYGLKDLFTKVAKKEAGSKLTDYGTAYTVAVANSFGVFPTRNFQSGVFEGAEKISGEAVKERFFIRRSACYRCPMACGRITKVDDPDYSTQGAGPEYEGLYALGGCCGIDNLAAVIKAFHTCNELGMDVMTCGATIGCAMEMSEKGVLPEKDVGMKLRFGDAQALVDLVHKIGHRDGFGNSLAEGSYRFAATYGHPEFSINVKMQEPAGYDPRGSVGLGLGYATSNRGACHMRGEISDLELFGMPELLDRFTTLGKAAKLIELQNEVASIDSMGICWLCASYRITKEYQLAGLELSTGAGYDWETFMKAGERIWNLERVFNLRAGFTAADDTLPRRFTEETMPEGPSKGHVCPLNEMLPEYYRLRGWDTKGIPTQAKLKALGLM